MNNKHDRHIRSIALAGMLAAIITVGILLVRIPVPGTSGYVHVGDAVIYIAAYILPLPYAIAACAIGGALADGLVSAVVYIIPTALTKSLMVLGASCSIKLLGDKKLGFLVAFIAGALLNTIGYFVCEWIMFGMAYAVSGVLWNLVQGAAGALIAAPFVTIIKHGGRILRNRDND